MRHSEIQKNHRIAIIRAKLEIRIPHYIQMGLRLILRGSIYASLRLCWALHHVLFSGPSRCNHYTHEYNHILSQLYSWVFSVHFPARIGHLWHSLSELVSQRTHCCQATSSINGHQSPTINKYSFTQLAPPFAHCYILLHPTAGPDPIDPSVPRCRISDWQFSCLL